MILYLIAGFVVGVLSIIVGACFLMGSVGKRIDEVDKGID